VAERRDREALRRLHAHYGPRVKAYLRRRGATDDAAEALTQEVMLAVWRRAHHFDARRTDPGTWVFAIARDARVDAGRRDRGLDPDPGERALDEQDEAGDASGGEAPWGVRDALDRLPGEQAEFLRAFFHHGDETSGATANAPGLPRGAARSRLRAALGGLRSTLGVTDR
jgi:RNA polymerase sigma-70 factor (ECF subfamily)